VVGEGGWMGLLERWFSFAYLFFCCCLFVGLFMIPDAFIAIHVFMFFLRVFVSLVVVGEQILVACLFPSPRFLVIAVANLVCCFVFR
jgi:hypothetical protein